MRVERSGHASGSRQTALRVAPKSTAGSMSAPSAQGCAATACSKHQLAYRAERHTGHQHALPALPQLGLLRKHPADAEAGQQDGESRAAARRWCRKLRANSAVSKGPSDMVTSTLATLVIVKASMKALNCSAQNTPEAQSDQPPERSAVNSARPRSQSSSGTSASAVNGTAPEGDLKALRLLKLPADDARAAPEQRDEQHQPDRSAMAHAVSRT